MFRHNLGLKLIAVIIALTLEVYLQSPTNSRAMDIAGLISFRDLPESRMVIWPKGLANEGQVRVHLKGPAHIMESLKVAPIPVEVLVPLPVPNHFRVTFADVKLNLPPGVEVLQFEPPHMDVNFETVLKRELVIEPDLFGVVKEGFEVRRVKVFPPTVSAQGPRKELVNIPAIFTRQIDVSGWDMSRKIDVELTDLNGMISVSLNYVTVEIEIAAKQADSSFVQLPVNILSLPGQGVVADQLKADVVVIGSRKNLDLLTSDQIKLTIDVRNLPAGRYLLPIDATLPEVFSVKTIVPANLPITIKVSND